MTLDGFSAHDWTRQEREYERGLVRPAQADNGERDLPLPAPLCPDPTIPERTISSGAGTVGAPRLGGPDQPARQDRPA